MSFSNLNILYEDNHLLVAIKPANMPMQSDASYDLDLLSYLKAYLKEKYQKPNNVYLALIHRLDRPVSGICVFAKTSKAAARLSDQLRQGLIKKRYYAIVTNAHKLKDADEFIDHLLKNAKSNTSFVSKDGKIAKLTYTVIKRKEDLALVDIHLLTGRHHQIRVQFASRNHPLLADHRYHPNPLKKHNIALMSYYLSFNHPTKNEMMEFKINYQENPAFKLF